MGNVVVIGAQWGDEGKGKIVDLIMEHADVAVRFQGGNNAGHTLDDGENKYVLHLVPSGALHGKKLIVGNGVVVNPYEAIKEVHDLRDKGHAVDILFSERAHLTLPYHIALNIAIDNNQGTRSAQSTVRGIAPTYGHKATRDGMRIADLLMLHKTGGLEEHLKNVVEIQTKVLEQVYGATDHGLNASQIYQEIQSVIPFFEKHSGDVSTVMHNAIAEGKKIVFECAQGAMLDIDHGMYPFTTSSNTGVGGIFSGLGIGIQCGGVPTYDRVVGIVKAYLSRVGGGPLPTELLGNRERELREAGREYGATTGRPRRVGWLDLVAVKKAIRENGITEIAMTKLDVLRGIGDINVCLEYQIDGKPIDYFPATAEELAKCEPAYHTLPGFNEDISQCRQFKDLPLGAQNLVTLVQEYTKIPVTTVSVGPERTSTIHREAA